MNIFTDGGLIGKNPSRIGGTWAYCFVDDAGQRVAFKAGVFTPQEVHVEAVSNNLTELFAAVSAIHAAEPGWCGRLYTDSRVTQCRIARTKKQSQLKAVPSWLVELLLSAKERAGGYTVALVGGHPTRRELSRGFMRSGIPCSVHNVFVDRLAREQGARYLRSLEPKANGEILS